MKKVNWLLVLAVVVGFVCGGMTVAGIEGLGHEMYPPPEGVDMTVKENAKRYVETAPPLALLMIPIAWIAGTFIASLIGTLICPSQWRTIRFVISAVFLVLSVAMLITFPSTWYMWAIPLLLLFPFGFMGTGVAKMIRK